MKQNTITRYATTKIAEIEGMLNIASASEDNFKIRSAKARARAELPLIFNYLTTHPEFFAGIRLPREIAVQILDLGERIKAAGTGTGNKVKKDKS